MSSIVVREMIGADRAIWSAMRQALWPEANGLDAEIDAILNDNAAWGFIAERAGTPLGFAEISIRKAANGCESQPVPFLEGIWVETRFRRQGIGRLLLAHVEAFLRKKGYVEIGSDSLIDNLTAHTAHRAWGFNETETVVYFRKGL